MRNTPHKAFTLPVVIIISTSMMIILLALVQSTASISDSLNDQYLNRLASEAAEAGATYANACLNDNDFVQQWSTIKPLKPNTDCSGNTLSYAQAYVMTNGSTRTSFSVGDLETNTSGAILLASSGTLEQTLGNSSTVTRTYNASRKEAIRRPTYVASVSASGTSKTCAVVSNELYCWGLNSTQKFDGSTSEAFSGQLGDGTTTNSKVPVKVRQDAGVLAGKVVSTVSSAQYHSCALAEGKVYCWGNNTQGQLGQGSTSSYSSVPVQVNGALAGKIVTDITTSGNTSCAIAQSKIFCWGYNGGSASSPGPYGTTGTNSTAANITTPTLVATNATTGNTNGLPASYAASALSSSGSRSYNICAIADDKAYCWGNNQAGQLGNGTTNNSLYPVAVLANLGDALNGKTVTAISQDGYYNGGPAYTHVCAIADNALYCWGENGAGQLGIASGNTTDSSVPVAVKANNPSDVLYGKTVQNVAVGLQHTCVQADSKAYCWGISNYGQVGNGSTTTQTVPVAVKANATTDLLYNKIISGIGGGANRGCAIAGYQSYCWGLNTDAQLGDGTTTNSTTPVEAIFLRPKAPVFIF